MALIPPTRPVTVPPGRGWWVGPTGFVALVALVGMGGVPTMAAESGFTPERFLAECKDGLAKLEERARHCHGRYKFIDGGAILDVQDVYEIEFAVSGENELLKTRHTAEKRKGSPDRVHDRRAVRAANAAYSFHVSAQNETGQYRFDGHELASEVASDPRGGKIRGRIEFWMDPVRGTHWMGQYPLRPLLDHPTFRIRTLTDQTRDGVPVVRAEFDSRPGEPQTHPRISWSRGALSGWFEVAPGQGWTIRAFEYTHFVPGATPEVPPAKSREVGEVRYAPGPDGLPVIAWYKRSTSWLDRPLDGYFEMNDVQIAFDPTPDEQFRLTFYGLPEPVGVAPPPPARTPVYWWLLGAGGGFAVAGLVFRRLARRRTVQTATS